MFALHDFTCNIIHHFERDKRHGFRFVPLLNIVLKFFLSDRMVHYVQFLGETVNTFLTDVERGWRRGIIYFCIKRKSCCIDQYANVMFLRFLAAVSAWLKHNL